MDPNRITYFGETDYRNQKTRFGIKAIDRTKHVYVIGKSGMGKSTLLENMAVQDIQNGEGIAIIDPHGGTAEKLLHYVPDSRIDDVIYFAPFDLDYPIALNVMENVGADKRHLVASGLMSAFKKIWVDAWSARMEYILNNTILALLEYPGATLLSVNKMLADKDFRKDVLEHVTDPSVKSFWVDEFAKYTERMAQEAVPAIQNKVGQFTANPVIRNIIGNASSSFDFREAMDTKKIIIINLSKGRLGEQNAALLGALLITKIYLSAMSRADVPETLAKSLPSFNFFVDEFQSFASDSFADILAEARKYKLCLHLAHQYVEQMSEQVKAAVFGNVGTMIVFRVGSTDAEIFEKEFAPTFTAEDIVNLDFTQMYLRMTIDGIGSRPFSAKGLGPIAPPAYSNKDLVIDASRKNYARPRAEIEEAVKKLLEAKIEIKKPRANILEGVATNNSNNNAGNSFKKPELDNKVKAAFANAFKDYSQPKKEVEPEKPKGMFGALEDEVKKEAEAIVLLEKAYDNHLSTSFVKNEKPEQKIVQKQENKFEQKNISKPTYNLKKPENKFEPKPENKPAYKAPQKLQFTKPAENQVQQKIADSKIKPFNDRSAKPENMMALKDFLAQVVTNDKKTEPVANKVIQPNKPEDVLVASAPASAPTTGKTSELIKDSNKDSFTAPQNNTHEIIKEVPEDVLQKILNQTH